MTGFCPACLRWAIPVSPDDDADDSECAHCGTSGLERFVTLLARASAAATAGTGPMIGIGLSDQLEAGLRIAGIDVQRVGRSATSPSGPAANVVAWMAPAGSSSDLSPELADVARVLSSDGEAVIVWEPPSDGAEPAFSEAGVDARRVAAGHVLPGLGLRLMGIQPSAAAWSLHLLPREASATTADLSGRMEAQLFAALAVAGTHLEAKLDHLQAVASRWERAYSDTRRRRALRAADAARALARRIARRTPHAPTVRLPPEPSIGTFAEDWIDHQRARPGPLAKAPAVDRPTADIPAVSPRADALLGCRPGARAPRLRLVLHEFNDDRVFAGIRTALKAAVSLARTVDLPLTVMLLQEPADRRSIGSLVDWFRTEVSDQRFVDNVRVMSIERDPDEEVHANDLWMLTYWTTAVAASQAVRAGVLDPRRAVYLVQDYEPGFFGWSDESAMAATTYRQGFHHVVNSRPLARYLADVGGVSVPPDQVFAPVVDVDLVERAAATWRPDPEGRLRVLFYGRPRHPRNLFRIGLESLRLWIETLDDDRPLLRSAGADHPPYRIARDVQLEPLGKLSLEGYVEVLSRTDLTLALMFSPHPGHLSLEPPAAGIPTLTNRFGSYREAWLPTLYLADPDPQALAHALAEAAQGARGLEMHVAQRLPATLGVSLDDAIRTVASRL